MRFSVYDVDNPKKLKRNDLIGDVCVPLSVLLGWAEVGGTTSKELTRPTFAEPTAAAADQSTSKDSKMKKNKSTAAAAAVGTIHITSSILRPDSSYSSVVSGTPRAHSASLADGFCNGGGTPLRHQSHNGPPVTLMLSLHCRSLPERVISGGKSVRVVGSARYMRKFKPFGRTEWLAKTNDPLFSQPMTLDHWLNDDADLRLAVYSREPGKSAAELYVGEMVVSARNLLMGLLGREQGTCSYEAMLSNAMDDSLHKKLRKKKTAVLVTVTVTPRTVGSSAHPRASAPPTFTSSPRHPLLLLVLLLLVLVLLVPPPRPQQYADRPCHCGPTHLKMMGSPEDSSPPSRPPRRLRLCLLLRLVVVVLLLLLLCLRVMEWKATCSNAPTGRNNG